jgi:TolB-like protein
MSLFNELKRRNVFRVVGAYIVLSWLLLQIGDVVFGFIEVPDWAGKLLLVFIALGFIPAIVFSWAYELTPEGIKKESEITRTDSVTPDTGRKLNLITIGMIVFAVGFAIVDRVVLRSPSTDNGISVESPASEPISAGNSALTPSPDRKSIAVLPFDSFSEDPADAYFASGVQEDILTHLARIADLRVISRSSVEQYSENRPAVSVIAEALNVGHILEGSVRRAGNKVRVTAQLIDARTDEHLWADNFDRDLTDVFAIQTEIAKAIAAAMKASLSADEEQLISQRPTENMEAYDLYVRARLILQKPEYSAEKYIDAEPLLLRALELDPNFALAHTLIADVHGQAIWMQFDDLSERRAAMKEAVDQALSLSPNLPEAQAALGEYYYRVENDYGKAIVELEAAHKRLPSNGEILFKMGMTYRRLGRWDEAIGVFEQARKLDPANHFVVIDISQTLLMLRRWDEVIELVNPLLREYPNETDLSAMKGLALLFGYGRVDEARSVIAGRPPSRAHTVVELKTFLPLYERDLESALAVFEEADVSAYYLSFVKGCYGSLAAAQLYLSVGEFDLARKSFEQARDQVLQSIEENNREYWAFQCLAESLSFLGDNESALAAVKQALRILAEQEDRVQMPFARLVNALILTRMGKSDQALDELSELLEVEAGVSRWQLALDPKWDILRDNPRFAELAHVETVIGD